MKRASKLSCWWGVCSQVMPGGSADLGVEGVDSGNVHSARAPLVFSSDLRHYLLMCVQVLREVYISRVMG